MRCECRKLSWQSWMGIVAKGGMKVYTSGVYGELMLRSATIWPSGLLFGIGDMFFVQNSGYDAE